MKAHSSKTRIVGGAMVNSYTIDIYFIHVLKRVVWKECFFPCTCRCTTMCGSQALAKFCTHGILQWESPFLTGVQYDNKVRTVRWNGILTTCSFELDSAEWFRWSYSPLFLYFQFFKADARQRCNTQKMCKCLCWPKHVEHGHKSLLASFIWWVTNI